MARRKKTIGSKIINFVIEFVKKAYLAGRLLELLISVPLLVGSYYLILEYESTLPVWVLVFPMLIFSCYWWYLFSHEKITNTKANPMWANRDWWWKLDGWQFEEEVAKVLRLNGYDARVTQKTSDGGIDILMYKDKKKIIVQCKHFRNPVGVAIARELNGLKDDFNADELVLIASSGVTKSCWKFLENKPYFKILTLEDIIRMGLRP